MRDLSRLSLLAIARQASNGFFENTDEQSGDVEELPVDAVDAISASSANELEETADSSFVFTCAPATSADLITAAWRRAQLMSLKTLAK